jgi:hypothetical protein
VRGSCVPYYLNDFPTACQEQTKNCVPRPVIQLQTGNKQIRFVEHTHKMKVIGNTNTVIDRKKRFLKAIRSNVRAVRVPKKTGKSREIIGT